MTTQKDSRTLALEILEQEQCKHIIYGYRAKRKTVEESDPNKMLRFKTDEAFVDQLDKMQEEIDGLEMALVVHAKD